MNSAVRFFLLVLAIAFVSSAASAQGGIRFGVGVNPLGPTLNGRVSLPLFEWGGVVHEARGDVTYGLAGLPGVSLTYQLSDVLTWGARAYVGLGGGVGFLSGEGASAHLSLHALAGVDAPLFGPLGAYGEVVVGGSSLVTNMRLALGLSYVLGGVR